ncbi:alpha-L-fucosidase [Caulobacter sp. D4A]|uniref:alpha-L-fucosidase n=1 Tax=unclassified Caulobacter TaxID=2648921 RepID=UPI000D73296F|nr:MULTISPECIES: alpha-L-fucosidase [unclassified Caulobacter]PXA87199.1 alpha-L-fucosidase [Caulobacter sp. D5]PXA94425.1 alpha-L-fucosidase [Caulobacter sp. D4A]
MPFTRRALLGATAGLAASPALAASRGPFKASWESLAAGYKTPDWFRDAKLGIWSHWGPQCVPEYGDWYGRQMYQQGNPFYEHHVKTYGHPTKFGFMEFIPRWKAQAWDPEALMKTYVAAGAKFFMSMANHHDNLDMFDSRHHAWNTTRVGPRRDIVGTWEKVARSHGLKFAVSNHAAHAWHWWQTAYGYDAEGPLKGQRYDAFRLTKADGKGKWWQGLDPQQLYTGHNMVIPDGVGSIAEANAWHDKHDGEWLETPPPNNPAFVRNWLLRQNDLVDRYKPDMVYFDNYALPLGQAGLEATAHFYNNAVRQTGRTDVVVTGKKLTPFQRKAIVEDVERGFSDRLRDEPWQTDTCIGNWHYDRGLYERNGYKTAKDVVQRLTDVVSKNGTLMLSIPQRGDGSIDDKEAKVLADMAGWIAVNGEAIYSTRPWKIYGEGPTRLVEGMQNEGDAKPFQATDIRFTTKAGALYALPLVEPEREMVIESLAVGAPHASGEVRRVSLLGGDPLPFTRDDKGLKITLPERRPAFTPVVKIEGPGLA